MQIQDNGHGIRKEDLGIVCERFTTSKLTTFEDLRTVSTFGFRGEALASITHVAHVTILTRTSSSPCAFRAKYEDGKMVPLKAGDKVEPKPIAGVVGTTISVEDLFYNMPTRKQALKNVSDEYQRVLSVVTKYSVRFGDKKIGFTCKKHGQSIPDLHTTSSGSTLENIRISYGMQVAKNLIDIKFNTLLKEEKEKEGIDKIPDFSVEGKVSNANYSHKKSTFIFFINDRLVDCHSMRKVIEAVYSEILPRNSHPFVYLSIRMPLEAVDVNVHPTKKEVHFLHEDIFLGSLHEELKKLLHGANESRSFSVQTTLFSGDPGIDSHPDHPILIPLTQLEEKSQNQPSNVIRDEDDGNSNDDGDDDDQVRVSNPALTEPEKKTFSSEPVKNKDKLDLSFFDNFRKEEEGLTTGIKRKSPFSSSSSSQPRNPPAGANKFVRTDPSQVKIDRIFKTIESTPEPTFTSQNLSQNPDEAINTPSLEDKDENENMVFCQPVGAAWPEALKGDSPGCVCCVEGRHLMGRVQQSPAAFESSSLRLPRFKETSCSYLSVRRVLEGFRKDKDSRLERILKRHTYVGAVDEEYSLLQVDTQLLLIHHSRLLHQLFYQLVFRQFAELSTLVLDPPLPLLPLLSTAVHECEGRETLGLDPRVVAESALRLLTMKAPMLKKYFSVGIDTANGSLVGLPVVLSGHKPDPTELPLFLLRLATDTEWDEEAACFHSIASTIADCYSTLETGVVVDENEGGGITSVGGRMTLSESGKRDLENLLYPALRQYFLPGREVVRGDTVTPVAALEQLYKIFERC